MLFFFNRVVLFFEDDFFATRLERFLEAFFLVGDFFEAAPTFLVAIFFAAAMYLYYIREKRRAGISVNSYFFLRFSSA